VFSGVRGGGGRNRRGEERGKGGKWLEMGKGGERKGRNRKRGL